MAKLTSTSISIFALFVALSFAAIDTICSATSNFESTNYQCKPSLSQELANLGSKHEVFSEFCVECQNFVWGDIKRASKKTAMDLFRLFFKIIERFGGEAKKKIEHADHEQLREEEELPEVTEATKAEEPSMNDTLIHVGGSENATTSVITNEVRNHKVEKKSLLQNLISFLIAIKDKIASFLLRRLNYFRLTLGADKLLNALRATCDKVHRYARFFRRKFNERKENLAQHNESVRHVKLEEVNCFTVDRVLHIRGLCRIASVTGGPMLSLVQSQMKRPSSDDD